MKRHAFHREAEEEYAGIEPELGRRFYDEIERLIRDIRQRPQRFLSFDSPIRRKARASSSHSERFANNLCASPFKADMKASGLIDAMCGVLGKNTTEARNLQRIRSRIRAPRIEHDSPPPSVPAKAA